MNNKLNYLLMAAFVLLLTGNGVLYFKLNNFSKDIPEIKKEQVNQKENIENLQNLITFNWKKYENDKFGFKFRHPTYADVCDETTVFQKEAEKTDLILGIRTGDTCEDGKKYKDTAPIHISFKQNIQSYKTAEEAFYKEFNDIDKSINQSFGYFKIGGLDAFGGRIATREEGNWITFFDTLGAVVLKNNYIVKFSGGYKEIIGGKTEGDKAIFDAIVSSFYFDKFGFWK